MIVKVGDSLGETFGNFVGRLAATLAVLTPVIPAFRASVLVVHPVLPDRDHAAMLTMVKKAEDAGGHLSYVLWLGSSGGNRAPSGLIVV